MVIVIRVMRTAFARQIASMGDMQLEPFDAAAPIFPAVSPPSRSQGFQDHSEKDSITRSHIERCAHGCGQNVPSLQSAIVFVPMSVFRISPRRDA